MGVQRCCSAAAAYKRHNIGLCCKTYTTRFGRLWPRLGAKWANLPQPTVSHNLSAASTEQTHMAHALHGVHSVHRKHIAATCIALCCTSHSALRALCSYAHTVAHVITPVSLSILLVHFVHCAHNSHPPPSPTVHFVHHRSMAMHMPSMQVGALGASHRHVVSPSVSGPPITLLHLVHLCPLGHYGACTVHGALTMYKCSVARPGPGWVALVGANPRSGGCGSTYVNLAAPIT